MPVSVSRWNSLKFNLFSSRLFAFNFNFSHLIYVFALPGAAERFCIFILHPLLYVGECGGGVKWSRVEWSNWRCRRHRQHIFHCCCCCHWQADASAIFVILIPSKCFADMRYLHTFSYAHSLSLSFHRYIYIYLSLSVCEDFLGK